jgi:nicotinate-nucleotide pyrophosphorylase (carboxylating)
MTREGLDLLLDAALEEDSAFRDVTTAALVAEGREGQGRIYARGAGIICGIAVADRLIERFDRRVRMEAFVGDGDPVEPGTLVAELWGPVRSLLALERTLLNFLQRLSGVATLTARFVDKVRGAGVPVYDTRKTTPGWRRLEKFAVRCGGGCNHRMSLGDAVLIKDNHLLLAADETGSPMRPADAVTKARQANPGLVVEVEVTALDQFNAVLDARPDIIMLDNMPPDQVRAAAAIVRGKLANGPRPLLEASGGINLDNVLDYARSGADRLAIGALTHSAPAMDLSMDVTGWASPAGPSAGLSPAPRSLP